MNKLNKFFYFLLLILTFGLIKIYWKTHRQTQIKTQLSIDNKITFSIDELIKYLNGEKNIKSVSATQKILKITLNNRENVDIDKIKALGSIEGILLQSNSISLITGNNAQFLAKILNEKIKNQD